MPKRQNNNRQNNRSAAQKARQSAPSTRKAREEDAKADLEQALEAAADPSGAVQAAEEAGIDPVPAPVPAPVTNPSKATEERLLQAFDSLAKQRELYEQSRERTTAREQDAEAALAAAESAAADAERERTALATAREHLTAQQAEVNERFAAAIERERAVSERELEANTGFHRLLAAKEQAVEDKWKVVWEERISALGTANQSAEDRLQRRETELAEREQQLDEEQRRIAVEHSRLRAEQMAVLRRGQEIEHEVEARSAIRVQELEHERHRAATQAESLDAEVDRMHRELAEIRSRWAAVGDRDPRELLEELDRLRTANRELRGELDTRLDADSTDQLQFLKDQNRELNSECERLRYDLEEERHRVTTDRLTHLQVTNLEDAKRQFDLICRGYEKRIAELEGRWSTFTKDAKDPTEPVFPNCVAIDGETLLGQQGLQDDGPVDLHALARGLQGAMFSNSERAYRLDDVCSFLGGMAMSRLHLLEGMSGIGKTSLPRAFAEALSAHCEIIEVQAGWRDQQDLFGHYNSFERRFHESRFLTALYKAGTPRHRDRPFFIVLDEMNLARPEQYFSVLLSRLESGDESPIQLAPAGAGTRPLRFDESGTGITIPTNVWFIGTANQDESTLEFADKTYNRSFILELPPTRPWAPRGGRVEPYTLATLQRAFSEAERKHADATKKVKSLVKLLGDDLYETCRVQVVPRVAEQLAAYVPVVVESRGTEPEPRPRGEAPGPVIDPVALAADQFVSTKILHQLRGKFEVEVDDIDKLEQDFDLYWSDHFPTANATRCAQVLADERRRRRRS